MFTEINPVELFFSIVSRPDAGVVEYDLDDWDFSNDRHIIKFVVKLKDLGKTYRIMISKKFWDNYMTITDVDHYIDVKNRIGKVTITLNRKHHKEIVKYIKKIVSYLEMYKNCDNDIANYNAVMKLKSIIENTNN